MSHWPYRPEREDGDPDDSEVVARTRRWLRQQVSRRVTENPLYGALADIEHAAAQAGFELFSDYDEDLDDVDEMGPY